MADNPLGEHVQGCLDEGKNCADERPVLTAGCDPTGKIKGTAVSATGHTLVDIASGGGGAVTVADCADVTQGCIADAAVTGDSAGTVNAHLRGIDKILADVWDSVNHRLNVFVQNAALAVTQSGAWAVDVTDRAARLLGHVTVDNFPASQPVSGIVDVTDRAARLLGHVTVDNFPASQAVTSVDGGIVTIGANADAAVTGDNAGTVNAHLRGIDKILFDVWDSVNHRLNVFIQNATLAVTQSGAWTTAFGYGGKATYTAANETSVSTGTVVGTNNSIVYLFHPASNNKRVEIERIDVTYGGGNSGQFVLILNKISAENATPGGTTLTPVANDGADAATSLVLRAGATGAPTRNATDTFVISAGGSSSGFFTFTSAQFPGGKPLVCRAGVAEGWEVRSVTKVTLSTASLCNANMVWTEA